MSTRRKTLASVLTISAAVTAWWWIRDIRMLQYSELQLYSLAGAVANYMAVTKGDYPAGLESLRALRLVEDVGEGEIVALPSEACADSVRQFPGVIIVTRDYDVAWNGDTRGTDGLMICSRKYPSQLRRCAERITAELASLRRQLRGEDERPPQD